MENENLNKFYGISFNQQNEFSVLWLLCQRGSLEVKIRDISHKFNGSKLSQNYTFLNFLNLQDVLFNEELKVSRNFQVAFAKDVVKVGTQF